MKIHFTTFNMNNRHPDESFKNEFRLLFNDADIIFIGLQESPSDVSFFSYDGYKRDEVQKGLLRLIILYKTNYDPVIEKKIYYPAEDGTSIPDPTKLSYKKKGAVAMNVKINEKILTVINVHLPMVPLLPDYGNYFRKLMYNDIINYFDGFTHKNHVIMGDFNFRKINSDDQFEKFMRGSYPKEPSKGDNTCKIDKKDGDSIMFNTKREPSRCDRILLSATLLKNKVTYSQHYENNMNSDHALVYLNIDDFQLKYRKYKKKYLQLNKN